MSVRSQVALAHPHSEDMYQNQLGQSHPVPPVMLPHVFSYIGITVSRSIKKTCPIILFGKWYSIQKLYGGGKQT